MMYRKLCEQFVQRVEATGLKGKKRDDAALEFMIGAAAALQIAREAVEDGDADAVARCAILLVATRGYAEVLRTATRG